MEMTTDYQLFYCLIAKRLHVCDNLTYFNQELIVDSLDLIADLLLPQHSWLEHTQVVSD